ncbi:ABC transporter ATP-binding protein [Litorihabitans aurantiacus]|uniref:ABC transporter ATP-binding protein n=1 Tax=Litorihabitans aurantiacus TaxID=1930061 RepID=A0AA37UH84_9MICO|nr:ABC transporter ATP-binding protein [Litorihabitans aurantiacus]GMA30399.1 ABC transporter ATP-binding protein [Litorihabitans aurantiacus]
MLLEVENLSTEFRTRSRTVRAVDDVSFTVAEGETVAVVGESGSGKSVTALSIMGLVQAPAGRVTGGSIRFEGEDLLSVKDPRRIRGSRVAMVFQDPMSSLNPVLTIGRQLTEAMRAHRSLSREEARTRAVELLQLVGIPDAATRLRSYPHQFSGGMRQRVMIAMGLSCDPALILADEITTALDVTIQAQILEVLDRVRTELGTAVLLITHDLGVVARMAERVTVMYGGQIVETATTADLFAAPRMPYTWGLLASVPRLDSDRSQPLVPIEGTPPDLSQPQPGCRFAARCAFAREICRTRPPALEVVRPGHLARCWGTQEHPDGGWLRGVDGTDREALAVLADAGKVA